MNTHEPVLLQEALKGLDINPSGIYIDCTFGRGGHSFEILARLGQHGRLIAIDKDLSAVKYAQEKFANDSRFQIIHGSFKNLDKIVDSLQINGKVNGILMDLGVSSPQLDDKDRGFSFLHEGPLDMRMDNTQELSAETFVNNASEQEMAEIFREFGEERFAKRISHAIACARKDTPIVTTTQLSEIVKQANPRWERHKHPATRVFQAIRIYVNQELSDLMSALEQSLDVLAVGGRLVVISFHSLEDRIVKNFMQKQEKGDELPKEVPIKYINLKTNFKRIGKAIKPLTAEVQRNVRARSAILRIGEKLT